MSVQSLSPISTFANGVTAGKSFTCAAPYVNEFSPHGGFNITGAATVHEALFSIGDDSFISRPSGEDRNIGDGDRVAIVKLNDLLTVDSAGDYVISVRARAPIPTAAPDKSSYVELLLVEQIASDQYNILSQSAMYLVGDAASIVGENGVLTNTFQLFTATFPNSEFCSITDRTKVYLWIFAFEDNAAGLVTETSLEISYINIDIDVTDPVLITPAGCSAFLGVGWRCVKLDWTPDDPTKETIVNKSGVPIATVPPGTTEYEDELEDEIGSGGGPLDPDEVPQPPSEKCYTVSQDGNNSNEECVTLAQVVYNDVKIQVEPMDLPYNKVDEQDISLTGLSEGNVPTYTPVSGIASPTYTPVTS